MPEYILPLGRSFCQGLQSSQDPQFCQCELHHSTKPFSYDLENYNKVWTSREISKNHVLWVGMKHRKMGMVTKTFINLHSLQSNRIQCHLPVNASGHSHIHHRSRVGVFFCWLLHVVHNHLTQIKWSSGHAIRTSSDDNQWRFEAVKHTVLHNITSLSQSVTFWGIVFVALLYCHAAVAGIRLYSMAWHTSWTRL